MPKRHDLEPLVGGLCYPECPRWHDGALWLSDQYDHAVLRIDVERRHVEVVARLDDAPSGLGWIDDGPPLVVAMHQHAVLRIGADGHLEEFADLAGLHGGPTNDMVAVPPDLVFVGNIGFDFYAGEELSDTVLIRIDHDGHPTVAATGLVCPNGMAISPDRRTLHVAESLAGRLTSFSIDGDGSLGDRRVFAALPDLRPDGICLDAEGAIWAACARTPEVLRVAPGGEILAVARAASNAVYACALGGPDRRTLFVCTSPTDIAEEAVAQRGGSIETCQVDVPGAGWP